MPNCPDCKGSVELEKVKDTESFWNGFGYEKLESYYYKCPVCHVEIDVEDIDERKA